MCKQSSAVLQLLHTVVFVGPAKSGGVNHWSTKYKISKAVSHLVFANRLYRYGFSCKALIFVV